MTTIELFLRLVRNALWQSDEALPEEVSANMSANLLRGGKEQGMLGLVIDALLRSKVRVPQDQVLELMVTLMKVKRSNELVNGGLRRLKTLLDERGIDFLVVKGQTVGAYYPDPTLRQAGDIDYYCDAKNFPKAREAMREAWGIEADAQGSRCHIHYDYQNVIYEAHFALTNFHSRKVNRCWQRWVDEDEGCVVNVDGMEVRALSPTLHTLFIFIHLYSHLLGVGVGFRQFCDLAVMLHACREEIDHDRLRGMLRTLGMERAFRAVGCILTESLGMPAEDLGYALSDKDRRYAQRLFAIVRYRGNMGHYNKRYGFSGWRHSIEAAGIKISHFMKLWPLAPAYSCRWIAYELTKKILPNVVSE